MYIAPPVTMALVQYSDENVISAFAKFVGAKVKTFGKVMDGLIGKASSESLMNWLEKFPNVYLDISQHPISIQGSEADLTRMASNVDMLWELVQDIMEQYNVTYVNFKIVEN